MKDEKLKFNGYYAIVDDCDNVFFESKNYNQALTWYLDYDGDRDVWLTAEKDLYIGNLIEYGFTRFIPVSIEC